LIAEGEYSTKKTHFEYPQIKLKELKDKIYTNDKIKVYTNTKIKDLDGFVGNFSTNLDVNGKDETIEHGVIIVATGANEYKPTEYLYGKNKNVIRQSELEVMLDSGQFEAKSVVMIQCVGCRNDERPYCSRVCCATAVKNALKIKELSPDTAVYVINKDLRTYGLREDYYRVAMKKGVIFFKYHDDDPPKVEEVNGRLKVRFRDYNVIDEEDLQIDTNILALSAATVPDIESNEKLAQILKVPLTKDNFFLEAHMKLRPVDFATDGIFVAGLAHGPKFIDETISQACGAVARACTILSKDNLEAEGIIANVNPNVCDGCGICEPICEYKAIEIIQHPKNKDKNLARVNEVLCRGCGACVGICPSGALEQKGFTNYQIYDMIDSFLESVFAD
jgi:heterodisulfide reductase subunit A